ncbi:mannose-1-phosphate guanylyltransferase/mannose-6-phosphate isomerase [Caballeronia sordidicola]|uniref:mannose-1-phosphate guanylyltransferase n=1 Tax=Caballeronia sordidicola TaxID=196367 RepID=A0A242N5Y4_CABSO|nr:mannose-1-phosphate guanylyltransferase/mannose-6-phosphate isomerase [Caballeronia sordidicola]OTP78982.1 Mannose-1-phosphate guanylyltransferase (GDP) [Caballeronia sordidicola]
MNTKVRQGEGDVVTGAEGVPADCRRLVQVVLAGGSGTRLWPVSRENFPKQLIGVVGAESLLQATVLRMKGFPAAWDVAAEPVIVCGEEHRFATAEQVRDSGASARIVVEPARRDTAPALTLAALTACADGQDAILVAMPADHAIADVPALHAAIDTAARHAQAGEIATLGIPPTRPDTGFGYIRLGDALKDGAHRIDRFVEKPAAELAAQYVASGNFWWNSGIFIVRASVWLAALEKLQPEMYAACVLSHEQAINTDEYLRPCAASFQKSPSDSIDYAVMEHLGKPDSPFMGVVVPLQAGWSDLGSWDAVWDAMDKDEEGNASSGRVLFEGSTASYARSEGGRLVACVGTNNLIVVETDDAVLVADRSRVQDIKGLVSRIKREKAPEADTHRKVRRPWGFYDSIDHGERFQVKRIVVNPGARLSLQMHHHRAEHWIVVSGTALVTRGEEEFLLSENESTYIPLGVRHRLENPGRVPLEIIEVQSGTYLGEDDIVRFDDKYGRCS